MKRMTDQIAFPVAHIVMMVAFLTAIFLADANLSLAASQDKKTPEVMSRPSAVDHAEARIKELQGVLKLTDVQKEKWNTLTQVMRENAKEMDAMHEDRADKSKTMNAVDSMKFHSKITETHLSQLQKIIPPFEALYATMSDAQKKSTDTIFHKGMSRKNMKKKSVMSNNKN